MTDIVGEFDVVSQEEALGKLIDLTTFTNNEAEGALNFIVSQFADDFDNVNWSFALDVALWVYAERRKIKAGPAAYANMIIYRDGEFYKEGRGQL